MAQLALAGGRPTKTKPFPEWPQYDERERDALLGVLDSRVWWRTPGTRTLHFERDFAAYHQARHGIAVTNGTHALEVALLAAGIGPGDEVIVPDYTFVATASAVLMTGAVPVLVDVRADNYCIDCDQVEAAIGPRTKAILPVHMGGHAADLDRLTEIAHAPRPDLVRRLRPRPRQPVARPAGRHLRPCRHLQLSAKQVDDRRRRGHHHHQRRRYRTAASLGPRLRPHAGRVVLQPLHLRFELSAERVARGDPRRSAHPARRTNAPPTRQRPSAGSAASQYPRHHAASFRYAHDPQRALRVHLPCRSRASSRASTPSDSSKP